MTDQIPPMPTMSKAVNKEHLLELMQDHARNLAARLAASQAQLAKDREGTAERVRQINQLKEKLRNPEKRFADLQALAGDLAEALECFVSAMGYEQVDDARLMANAALTHYREATRKHHPNCSDPTRPIGEGMCCCDRKEATR